VSDFSAITKAVIAGRANEVKEFISAALTQGADPGLLIS